MKVSCSRRAKLIRAVSRGSTDANRPISTVATDSVAGESHSRGVVDLAECVAECVQEKASMAGAIMEKSKTDKEEWEKEKAALQGQVSVSRY